MQFYACIILATLIYFNSNFNVEAAVGHRYTRKWPQNQIYFRFETSYTQKEKQAIKDVLRDVQKLICVRFNEVRSVRRIPRNQNLVTISKHLRKCYSEIGKKINVRYQSLHLGKNCLAQGTIKHELAHLLGLMHEPIRPDRDSHIQVLFQNMHRGYHAGFHKDRHAVTFGTNFDLQSITLYGNYEMSHNGNPIWIKRNSTNDKGVFDVYAKDFSFDDVKFLNRFYQCHTKCRRHRTITCPSPGFIDRKCRCITPLKYQNLRCVDKPPRGINCTNVKLNDQCYSERSASWSCRKSCGKCYRADNNIVSQLPPRVCTDNPKFAQNCLNKKQNGMCWYDLWTKFYCAKTCNTCDNKTYQPVNMNCKNLENDYLCEMQKKAGRCRTNAKYYHGKCAQSCGTCRSSNPTATVIPPSPCRNYWNDAYCDKKARRGCARNQQLLKFCKGSCNLCGTNYVRQTTVKPRVSKKVCKDKSTRCTRWKQMGFCTKNRKNMKYWCCKTCKTKSSVCLINLWSQTKCAKAKQRNRCSWPSYKKFCCKTCKSAKCNRDQYTARRCQRVKQRGLCSNSNYKKVCCKTCKASSTGFNSPSTSTCTRDQLSKTRCQQFKRRRFCLYNSYRKRCCKTCAAQLNCRDSKSRQYCLRVTRNRQCRYSNYSRYCVKSCRKCA